MIIFFRKLPLTYKLLMIGIIPILFLLYFSVIIYKEKSQRVKLIGDYIEHVDQSANLGELINELGRERKFSYQYAIKKAGHEKVLEHRLKTDSIIDLLKRSSDLTLINFTKYTFLDDLADTRASIDTLKYYPANTIVQYYTDVIVRLNTLNAVVPSNTTFLKPVNQDLIAQKILFEMVNNLGTIRTNIFNALYTRENMEQTLLSTSGLYKIYKTYETEFLLKASPASVKLYNTRKILTDYSLTQDYLDRLFTTFSFDTTYNAEQWWDVSTEGMKVLRKQQLDLWKSVDTRMKAIYQEENNSKKATIGYLLISLLFVIVFISYSINNINQLLIELKHAARKISKGETGLQLENMPKGVIGNLAKSIVQIDKNNLLLANAANEIGKGNFNVVVKPRSGEDLLGISIKKMKLDLCELTSQKDKVQQQTLELVMRRDEFFSIASHELKTPVTTLKAYTQLLLMEAPALESDDREIMLKKMDAQINKLTSLINDLLDTSKLQNGQLIYDKRPFNFNELVSEIVEEIQLTTNSQQLIIKNNASAEIVADRSRIGQVLRNLLTNAIRFARDSKEIVLDINKKGSNIICSVRDFGTGIKSGEQNRIFERYYRISGNNLHTYPGLGLGLYISKEIIEKHGGKIWMESPEESGSIFYFELPILNYN